MTKELKDRMRKEYMLRYHPVLYFLQTIMVEENKKTEYFLNGASLVAVAWVLTALVGEILKRV